MIRKAHRFMPSALLLMILPMLLNAGCGPSKYTVAFSEYTLPFVTVREADFRCGPVDLPLTEESRGKIATFLQRGGNWGNYEFLDYNTPTYYEKLLDLLSDPKFLHSSNFREETAIDQVSAQMKPWFHNPIIYQIIDGTKQHPSVPNPICVADGKYWWIFYTGKRLADSGDLEITKVLINAPLSRTMKHYQKIKEAATVSPAKDLAGKGPPQTYADAKKEPKTPQDMHSALVRHLMQVSDVQLVARLKDARLGHAAAHGVRVFIPDVHLLSKDRVKDFKYATNYVDVLTEVAGKLISFKQAATGVGVPVTVYQLGDFVDLWREDPMYFKMKKAAEKTELNVQKVLESHLTLTQRLFGPELGTRRVLGNHDFDIHELETGIGVELRYYFPYDRESYPVAVALHGDVFDTRERRMSEWLEHAGVYHFGPKVEQKVYDLEDLSAKIVQDHQGKDYKDHIQLAEPASLGKSAHVRDERNLLKEELAQSRFNVKVAGDPSVPEGLFKFLPEAEYVAGIINDQTGWDLRLVVIGHTHHARIAVDERAEKDGGSKRGFFALVDCGAWLESGNLGGQVVRNAQIGVLYDNDVRIYQLSPKQ
jgi:UDP-2,3-diacylglucosamine pyrophosphatase LpxH